MDSFQNLAAKGHSRPSKRFKGIETFLRRLAYNLGNSPSQTEVKIISCIPIDVTDLQQKILDLEKELEETRRHSKKRVSTNSVQDQSMIMKPSLDGYTMNKEGQRSRSNRNIVYNALCGDANTYKPGMPYQTGQYEYVNEYERPVPSHSSVCLYTTGIQPCDRNASTKRKSSVSFAIDNQSNYKSKKGGFNKSNSNLAQYLCGQKFYFEDSQCKDREPLKVNNHKSIINNRKNNLIKRKKDKTQYVYYAQHCGSPFISQNGSPYISADKFDIDVRKNLEEKLISRDYLSKVIQRQYKPRTLGNKLSTISNITSPICKDATSHENIVKYESEVCSEVPFHNIDELNKLRKCAQNVRIKNNGYYDSNFYDIVPVKEQPTKTKKDTVSQLKNESHPESKKRIDTRFRNTRYDSPTSSNYVEPGSKKCSRSDNMESYVNSLSTDSKENDDNKRFTQVKQLYRMTQPNSTKHFENNRERKSYKPLQRYPGEQQPTQVIYHKKLYSKSYKKTAGKKKSKCVGSTRLPSKNAACFATFVNCGEIQTITSNREVKPEPKTDSTINQIKNILQSVLTEVKVSKEAKSMLEDKFNGDGKLKKDAQNYIQDTMYQKNLNYNPYNTPYLAPCPPNLSTFMYPENTLKCIQNMPILIPAHQSYGCYRNSFYDKKIIKPTTTAATNTEKNNLVGRIETERLIHEIYKSIALTMDDASKETSNKDLVQKTESVQVSPRGSDAAVGSDESQAESEMSVTKDKSSSSDTRNTTYMVGNNYRSQLGTDTETNQTNNERAVNKFSATQSMKSEGTNVDMGSRQTVVASTTNKSALTSRAPSESTIAPRADMGSKTKKEGLFSKLISVFRMKEKPMRKETRLTSGKESSLESDHYQAYSQRVEKPNKPRTRIMINPPHLRARLARREVSEKPRRTPYMEQEYRRYWDEVLMFHGGQEKSCNGPYSEHVPYGDSYEVRSALVTSNKPAAAVRCVSSDVVVDGEHNKVDK